MISAWQEESTGLFILIIIIKLLFLEMSDITLQEQDRKRNNGPEIKH
jgi:hypothetical protein